MYHASQMNLPSKMPTTFPSDHMMFEFGDWTRDSFFASSVSQYIGIWAGFGIDGLDRSKYKKWVPNDNRGEAIFH